MFTGGYVGTVPLYRAFASSPVGNHLYTTNGAEAESLRKAGWEHQGIAGHVYPSAKPGTAPLHRLRQNRPNHFYTTNEAESNAVRQQPGWNYEGIIGHMVVKFTVSNLAGKTKAQAQSALTAVALTYAETDTRIVYNRADLDGKVAAQSPAAGKWVKFGAVTTLTLYKNINTVMVPDVAGKNYIDAARELTSTVRLALNRSVTYVETLNTALMNRAKSTNPPKGTMVQPLSSITLTMYKAPSQVTVPDITGKTSIQAQPFLNAVGLTSTSQDALTTHSSYVGKVESTVPPGGLKRLMEAAWC